MFLAMSISVIHPLYKNFATEGSEKRATGLIAVRI